MGNANFLPGNTLSEDTTCVFLDSMNIKKEEKKISPKMNDKLAQLVQQRWEGIRTKPPGQNPPGHKPRTKTPWTKTPLARNPPDKNPPEKTYEHKIYFT